MAPESKAPRPQFVRVGSGTLDRSSERGPPSNNYVVTVTKDCNRISVYSLKFRI